MEGPGLVLIQVCEEIVALVRKRRIALERLTCQSDVYLYSRDQHVQRSQLHLWTNEAQHHHSQLLPVEVIRIRVQNMSLHLQAHTHLS